MKIKLLLAFLLLTLVGGSTAGAQSGGYYAPFASNPYQTYSPYFPPSYPDYYRGYFPGYYSGTQMYRFDGGLYGTYGGYQPLGIASGRGYANPPYLYSSPGAAPRLSMDGGTYSLGAQRRLRTLTRPSRGEIKIVHKKDASSDVAYSLNGSNFTIKPGEEQIFADDRNWIITIPIESSDTPRRFTLKTGKFQFVPVEGGWSIKEVVRRETSTEGVSPLPEAKGF